MRSALWLVVVPCALLFACAWAGPASIENGRMVYNEVITRTHSEQVLAMIVRLRYGEAFGMLKVASVTASIKVGASVGGQAGIGPSQDFEGNLVPFSAGVAYEENPTISYIPVSGDHVVTELFSPLPASTVVSILSSADEFEQLLPVLISRMNCLRKPHVLERYSADGFDRACEILGSLHRGHMLGFGVAEENPQEFVLIIHDFRDTSAAEVHELLDLLQLRRPPEDHAEILIPLHFGVVRQSDESIVVEPRSLMNLILEAGDNIDIPEEHRAAGIILKPDVQSAGPGGLVIRSSRARPTTAVVMTRFRDHWFYIDESDARSKMAFLRLLFLVGMRLDNASPTSQVPVLTIPVGG